MHLFFAAVLAVTQHWLVAGDLHLNPFDAASTPSAYHSDTNWPLLRATIGAMRKADPRPDVVVLAGDFLAHQYGTKAQAAGQDPARSAEHVMAAIAQAFNAAFPRAQFIVALGNNDDPCGDYRTGPDTPYLAAVARAWAPLVNRRGAAPTFIRDFAYAGYYTAALPQRMRAVVLDDVYWSLFFRGCGRAQDVGSQQSAWLDKTLGSLKPDEIAVPVMHIPPGVDSASTLLAHRFVIVPYWRPNAPERFTAAMTRYAPEIAFAIAAHTHRGDFRETGGVPVLVAPAVSPIYANNPSFVRVTFATTRTVSDYAEFSYDYDSGAWTQTFGFDRAYALAGFSATNAAIAHQRIALDPALREAWERGTVGNSDAWYGVRDSWLAYWCAQTQTGDGYIQCAGDRRRTNLVWAAGIAAVAVVLLLAVWYSRRRSWKRNQDSGV